MAADDRRRRPIVTDPRAAERRRSLLIRVGATAVVVAIALGVGVWLIVTSDSDSSSGTSASAATPTVVTATGAYRVSGAKTPPGTLGGAPPTQPKATLTLLEDFQCPACKLFESDFADALTQIRANPQVAVDYQPIAILDRMSSTNYSTRAAGASACVAQATATGGDFSKWLAFHDALYAQQPQEQSAGLSDDQLTSIATDSGAPASVSSCIGDGRYSGWVTSQTQKATQNGLQGTPQVELNGKVLSLSTPAALVAAVDAATNR